MFGMALTYQPVAAVHMWGFHQHRHARMLCMKIASILHRPFTLLLGNSTSPGLEGPGFPPGFNLPQTLLFVVYHGRSSPFNVAQVADMMMRQCGVCHGVMHLGSTGLGSLGTTFLNYASNWRAVRFGFVSEPPCKTWSRTSHASLINTKHILVVAAFLCVSYPGFLCSKRNWRRDSLQKKQNVTYTTSSWICFHNFCIHYRKQAAFHQRATSLLCISRSRCMS